MSEAAIQTIGTVLRRKGEIIYDVELMNGKIVLGHLSREGEAGGVKYLRNDRVVLELTPYDFDQARITGYAAEVGHRESTDSLDS